MFYIGTGGTVRIEKFGVERWMDLYETRCAHNLAETCVESITLAELAELAGKRDFLTDLPAMKMTYGAIPGSDRLRLAIAGLYHSQCKTNVLVTPGAIGANALVYQTLVEPGDHVVVTTPAYQQHLAMPRCYGARTSVLPLREENGFLPDVAELRQLLTPATKLLVFTNPNNPTGALMNRALLEDIAALAGQHGTYILCDEVYRGLDDTGDTPSMADLYEWGISTGSMSKAFSLAGLRLGWIVTGMAGILENAITHRDYTTISVGMLDDYFAAVALEAADAVLARSRRITRENRRILANWA